FLGEVGRLIRFVSTMLRSCVACTVLPRGCGVASLALADSLQTGHPTLYFPLMALADVRYPYYRETSGNSAGCVMKGIPHCTLGVRSRVREARAPSVQHSSSGPNAVRNTQASALIPLLRWNYLWD